MQKLVRDGADKAIGVVGKGHGIARAAERAVDGLQQAAWPIGKLPDALLAVRAVGTGLQGFIGLGEGGQQPAGVGEIRPEKIWLIYLVGKAIDEPKLLRTNFS